VLFFAEGTRSPDGRLQSFKKGAFRVAASQHLPVLPVTIIGTRDIQKPRSLMIFPGRIRMVIHPAIEVQGGDNAETVRELMTRTREAIASALPAELR
jgi:1-acyl-sn-glycerol-3-phosphate acyltransferase